MSTSRDAPPACPYLGLVNDERTRFLVPTTAHRCHAKSKPNPIDIDYQRRFCLSIEFGNCRLYQAVPAARRGSTQGVARSEGLGAVLTETYEGDPLRRPVISVLDVARPLARSTPSIVPESAAVETLRKGLAVTPENDTRSPIGSIIQPVAPSDASSAGGLGRPGAERPTDTQRAVTADGERPRSGRALIVRGLAVGILLILVAALTWVVTHPAVLVQIRTI